MAGRCQYIAIFVRVSPSYFALLQTKDLSVDGSRSEIPDILDLIKLTLKRKRVDDPSMSN